MRTTETDLAVWVRNCLARDAVILGGVPYCPVCGTRQVQIKDKSVPAQWKCRKCKHGFEHEPSHVRRR